MTIQKRAAADSAEQETVLLVEDDGNDVLLTTLALQRIHPTLPLRIVNDGEAAVCYLKGEGVYRDRKKFPVPTLVLLDINMPRKSGFEVVGWIRQQAGLKDLPVVVFSSSSKPADVHEAYRNGANSYLVKAGRFDAWVELLTGTVIDWMKHHRMPQSLVVQSEQAGRRANPKL